MKPDHRAALERAVTQMEKRLGRPIPEGSAPHLKPLRISLDKFNVYSRPFIIYAFIYMMNFMAKTRLQRKYHLKFATFSGLESVLCYCSLHITNDDFRYCIHIPDSWDSNSDTRPIVFFHGLGLGISQYKIALSRIIRNFSDRPLLVVLQPHISQNIFHPNFLKPMTREQTTERLAALLDQLGWANMERDTSKETSKEHIAAQKGVTMLSHSKSVFTSQTGVSYTDPVSAGLTGMPGCSRTIHIWSLARALSTQLLFAHGKAASGNLFTRAKFLVHFRHLLQLFVPAVHDRMCFSVILTPLQ